MTDYKIKLAIVEDYKLTRVAFRYSLREFSDIELKSEFSNAKDCIDSLSRGNDIDIILMDITLPSLNGIDAAKIIKKKHPNIKIIIITSSERERDVINAINAGASAYVLKDIEFDELYNIIKSVNTGSLFFNPNAAKVAYDIFKRHTSGVLFQDIKTLTAREKEVLNLMAQGLSNTEISKRLYISSHTAKAHVSNIIAKLEAKDRVHAAVVACKVGLLD